MTNPFDQFDDTRDEARFKALEGSGDNAVSPKGAKGRFQITKATAQRYGIDYNRLSNPDYAARSFDRIMADIKKQFPDDTEAQAVAYNAGSARARQWIRSGRKVDQLPEETQHYLAHNKALDGGNPFDVWSPGEAAKPKPKPKPGNYPIDPHKAVVRGYSPNFANEVADQTRAYAAPLAAANARLGQDITQHPSLSRFLTDEAMAAQNSLGILTSPVAGLAMAADKALMRSKLAGKSATVPEGAGDETRRQAIGDIASGLVPIGGGERAGFRVAKTAEEMTAAQIAKAQRTVERLRMADPKSIHAASVSVLTDHGFDAKNFTPGMIKGGEARRAEDAAKSKPSSSRAIRDQELKAVRELNRTWYDQALKPIGEKFTGQDIGYQGVEHVRDRIGAVYEKWLPRARARADAELTADLAKIRQMDTPIHGPYHGALSAVIDQHVAPRFENGVMTGESFKKVETELGEMVKGYRQKGERTLANQVDDIRAALRDSLERNSPPGVREHIASANTSWAIYKRLEAAAGRRPASGGVASPMDFLQSVKKLDRSKDKGAFARGDALMQPLAMSGYEVLRNVVGDSGTYERTARNSRGILGEMAGGALGATHGPIGAAIGAAVGGVADRMGTNAMSAAKGALLRRRVESLARHHAARTPQNYLARIGRATSPLVNHRDLPIPPGVVIQGTRALVNGMQDAPQGQP